MAIISFWSETTKQTGQTMSIVAMATSMATEHNYKILLMSTQYNDNSFELCFGSEGNKKLLSQLEQGKTIAVDNGIEGLSKVANSGRLVPELIQNYTRVIYKNRLEILSSYKEVEDRPTKEEYLKAKMHYKDIVQNAGQFYDVVLVDLNKGMDDKMVKDILGVSDLIVYNIEQKMPMIDKFLQLSKEQNFKRKNNLILNIGRFDNNSKYSVKNISRYVGLRKDVTVIPYNTLYFEASNEENVADLFLRIRKVNELDKNSIFIREVQNAVEVLIYKVQELQVRI